mmetsp:Transcript_83055/g.232759  ORF Transcript_83055/g.232759 Transcript_83055/m.232759 type:complete len:141 (+) Transcript_83055:96-518(+)
MSSAGGHGLLQNVGGAVVVTCALLLQGCYDDSKTAACGGDCKVTISCGSDHSLIEVEGCGASWRVWRQAQARSSQQQGDLLLALEVERLHLADLAKLSKFGYIHDVVEDEEQPQDGFVDAGSDENVEQLGEQTTEQPVDS